MVKLPKIIALVGLTASGKSDLALAIAKEIGGEVIAADSRTVYRGMDIGTAKPKGEKLLSNGVVELLSGKKDNIQALFVEKPLVIDDVPHWGFNLVDPDEDFTVADFKNYAEKKIIEIAARGYVPLLVGGTGLYIQAVVDNFGFSGVAGPGSAGDHVNGEQKYDVLQVGIDVDRDVLYQRINERVDRMIANGLVDEVRTLREEYGCEAKSMTGIGYRQICTFFDGKIKLWEAIDLIKRDTRHYAKRQWTWFKRDERIVWVKDVGEAMEKVRAFTRIGHN